MAGETGALSVSHRDKRLIAPKMAKRRFGRALAYDDITRELRNVGEYKWTPEKRGFLIKILERHPGYSYEQCAKEMNMRFSLGARAKARTICNKVAMDIYKERPDLRRRNERYHWDREKVRHLASLVKEHPGYSHRRFAEEMNRRFRNGVPACGRSVSHKLTFIYEESPGLREMRRQEWNGNKKRFLISLLKTHPRHSYQQYADAINERFGGKMPVTAGTIARVHLPEIYREAPELRRLRRTIAEISLPQEERGRLQMLRGSLNPIERDVADLRLLGGVKRTLQEIGDMHGVTRECVRVAQERVLERIR